MLRDASFHHLLLGHEFRITAQQNVGTAASHVGCNGDRPLASGLRDNFCLALVLLGVQDPVLHAFLFQQVRQPF